MRRRKIIWALHTENGEGVDKDTSEAVRWYLAAWRRSRDMRQRNIVWAMHTPWTGEGVAKDTARGGALVKTAHGGGAGRCVGAI